MYRGIEQGKGKGKGRNQYDDAKGRKEGRKEDQYDRKGRSRRKMEEGGMKMEEGTQLLSKSSLQPTQIMQ